MKECIFFYRGYLQALFVVSLVSYVWFFPEHSLRGSRLDIVADIIGIVSLALGAMLRIWAVSHVGRHTRSRTIKATSLIATGPYICVRNPIYLANFLIGLGLVVLAEAIIWLPFYFILFGLAYRKIVEQEESFLRNKFGHEFDRYCEAVTRWLPRLKHAPRALTLGSKFHLREFGTTFGTLVGAFFFEWIESPLHRAWITSLYQWLARISN
ncbi:MAG TPA: isoprenylcysteine carboxylmethyltransferase family protein [Candidatus Binatia bacterium]|jgi:protein-S-isoprenylcysteine O-methyltransferase Ste14